MLVLLYGDLHVNSTKVTYTECVQRTVQFLGKVIQEHRPKFLVNMGDTLDTFGALRVRDAQIAREAIHHLTACLHRADGYTHYVLRGNHDTGDKEGHVTSTDLLEMDGVEIVNQPHVYPLNGHNCLFVPYTRNFDMGVFETEYDLCAVFAHTDWIGCRLTPKHISTSGFEPAAVGAALPDVPVFSGHYHNPMAAGPVTFVGSPLYRDFNDRVEEIPRGFLLWETDTGELTRIENPHTYYCMTFTAENVPDLKKARKSLKRDGTDIAEKCRVRVYTKRRNFEKAEEIFGDCLWNGVYAVDNEKTEVEFGTKVSIQASPQEIVERAVAEPPEDLKKEVLTDYGRQAFHVT